ncbi:MAG: family 10 glycosylhydrolase [Lentisphaeria bacterium]|nr:family 10 glycosylhydrolase [Lentisphaeria bacterium]
MKRAILTMMTTLFFSGISTMAQELPDISTLDPHWANGALSIAHWGWGKLENPAEIGRLPFQPQSPGISLALPYDAHYSDFALKNPELLSQIVIEAEHYNPAHAIVGDELDGMMVYVSVDGKDFTPAKPRVTSQFHTVTDHDGKKTVWVRITLNGSFYGQYFRIYAPWGKPGYVYRFFNGPKCVKAFAKLKIEHFSVPMSVQGSLDYCVDLSGIEDVKGTAVFRLENRNILITNNLEEFKNNASATVSVTLPPLSAGIHTACLDFVRDDGTVLATRQQKFAYWPDKVVLSRTVSPQWQDRTAFIGSRGIPCLCATATGATAAFTVPRDGVFALYATLRGKGTFRFAFSQEVREHVGLDLWSPEHDSSPWVMGETFIGIAALKSGDIIEATAESADAQLGDVFIVPASEEQQRIYRDQTPEDAFQSIIVHGDGFSDFFFQEMTLPIMQERIASLAKAHVIAYDWCIGTSATNYRSQVATMFGKQRNVTFSRERDRQAAERMENLIQTTGKDSLQIFREETRKHNMLYSITLRPNAFYGKTDVDKNAQYLMDHPEFYITDLQGHASKPSYAYPEVRNFYLSLAKEIAAYKPDMMILEFLRHPPYFGYDKPLVERYRQLYGSCDKGNYMDEHWLQMIGQIMTDWIADVHREIKAIHPDIQLMISFDCKNFRQYGFDMEAILQRGLADAISPGFYGNGPNKTFALKPFWDMIKLSPKPVKLYPRVENTIEGHDPTPEEEAGLVKRPVQIYCSENQWKSIFYHFMQEGADGLRPFNVGGASMAKMLNDRAGVKRFVTFVEPLLDIRYLGYEETDRPRN